MIFLIEFGVHDGVAASKLYLATHGIASGPTDSPANQEYEPRLRSVGRLERAMFGNGDGVSGGTTKGRSQVGFGNISVLNGTDSGVDELIDDWKDLAFREVTIKSLTSHNQPFSLAVTRFVGSVEQLVSTDALEQYDMIIHDRLQNLDKPLLVNVYLGTTTSGGLGTVEGNEDLKDQIKPKIWGTVHNAQVVNVNPFDLLWQVSDGQVASIVVYDGGVTLTYDGDIGSLAALFATPIQPGHYATCNSLGIFRAGATPAGAVTADVIEGATAAERTAAQIAKRMLAWFGSMYGETLSLSASDIAALDALNAAECGLVVRDTENALDAIMRVLNSIGAWMLPQSDSVSTYNLGRLDPADEPPIASYDFDDNTGGNPQRVESGDDSRGVPAWKVIVKYDQLDTVQKASELFGVVTENDPIRVQYLATEWRQASAEDESVLDQWPNAPTITVETRFVTQSAAVAEADRLLEIYGEMRDIWRLVVPMSDDPDDDPGVGEVVELTSRGGRMGLGIEPGLGQSFRCLGRIDDFDNVPMLTLTLWGPFPNVAAAVEPPAPAHVPEAQSIEARFAGAGALSVNAVVPVVAGAKFGAATFTGAGSLRANTTLSGGAETDAWVAQVVNNGGATPSPGRQTAVRKFIRDLKSDGIWPSFIDRIWIYAGEDEPGALTDLKGLQLATAVGLPTFSSTGYQFNASSQYINTQFNPATAGGVYTRDFAGVGSWISGVSSSWTQIGAYDGSNDLELTSAFGVNIAGIINGGGGPINSGITIVTGLEVLTRVAGSGAGAVGYYRNGSLAAADTPASSGLPNRNLYVGALNNNGTASNFTGDKIAATLITAGLDATKNTNLYTRLRALMTDIGVP